jgi:predicted O-methyltransferase YrrM
VDEDNISNPVAADRKLSLQRLHQVIDRLLREGNVVAQRDGTTHQVFPVGITKAEGEALRQWVIREHAISTIEIGLAYGISALFICGGLLANGIANARHVVLDPHQETRFANCGLQLLHEAGVAELVEYQPTESEIVLPKFLAEGRRFDLAFVDGNHRFDGVFIDLRYLGQLVRPGGIIFLDDYQLRSVSRAVSFCTNNLGWAVEEESPDDDLHRWVVLRTALVPLQRPYDHYVDF